MIISHLCTKPLHLNSDPQLRKWEKILHLFPAVLNFSKLSSALYNNWSLLLSLCPFSFFTYCPFSKRCGCCSFSWATLSPSGGFIPNEWRLNLEALQVRATVADSEKNVGLCTLYSLCNVTREIWDTTICNDIRWYPLPACNKLTLPGLFCVAKWNSVCCSALFLLQF